MREHSQSLPISSPAHSREKLIDNYGRRITYVRLAVTDRCNLRCTYCMPEQGIRFLSRQEVLTYEEMLRLLHLLAEMGVSKVRITGGEPFVRRGLVDFLWQVREIPGIRHIHITTNGVLTAPHVPELQRLGIAGINLSLDSLDRERFRRITRRDQLEAVLRCFHTILEYGIPLKINTVLMGGINDADIVPLAMLSRDYPVEVRFIEEMPFNGTLNGNGRSHSRWDYRRILEVLQQAFPGLEKRPDPANSTSMNYRIPGHRGGVGIIAGFSRTFCGSCNRIRVNAKGKVQTCLYGKAVLDIRQMLREGATDEAIKAAVRAVVNKRFRDGWEAQRHSGVGVDVSESMSMIGG